MSQVKIKAPAKINLVLDVLSKRDDGFHNIHSIMQAVNLFDYLTINVIELEGLEISLSGTSDEIPYDGRNIVYKACEAFCIKAGIDNKLIEVFIEKNIPVAAGLAGGSTDAAATIKGLNTIFGSVLSNFEIDEILASLGSDLNFCYKGGACIATSRGEILKSIKSFNLNFVIVNPNNLYISAKEAYQSVEQISQKPSAIEPLVLKNDLEASVLKKYEKVREIKEIFENAGIKAIMSGSGPSVFGIIKEGQKLPEFEDARVFRVKAISSGCEVVSLL